MSKAIATPSRTKEILETYDLFTKKNYGQNFLIEPGIVEKIARSAVISDHCVVIEIGPGIGALTQQLAYLAQKVIAFEIDERLPKILRETLAEFDNVEIVNQDFLKVDIAAYVKSYTEQGYDVVVAANLPYYITTPILFQLFEAQAPIASITVMMQKEVADRFSAKPNSKDYNALSIITQYRCEVKPLMKVPSSVFQPKPAVDSAVVQFFLKKKQDQIEEEPFFAMIKGCFKQRRKTMLNNFGTFLQDKEKAMQYLESAGIDAKCRAESLTLEQFIRLYEVAYGS
ncbi:16S rRNA (adenine(1518)-N(6)/adenine(1519)-N(6))-dimethyltransferase RsmA [Massilicoli timonensis]|uniref:Ribosomal RNA small subunit methyltransferase A n=1 Tax=Massilicoli timonensis TaxID=2015901 RepID=A0ABT1SN09_9FIRM|nr:16S rRNA (adenine(1518)-N(6)/adenine(1519)-N(6))-dimethyltransferase RsmA [Massilicoli timonensis]MCQ5122611.1 16S rRNA (adenine(1518)-N(6)/adenine(1519)-N(6))-dimethyltransferase RsmA [Massilicoli timonensis]